MSIVGIGIQLINTILPLLTRKASNTNHPYKKLFYREIRENLKVLQDKDRVGYGDFIVDELSNSAILEAIRNDVKFNRLKKRKLPAEVMETYGFTRFSDWPLEKLIMSIDEKISDLKRWHHRFPSICDAPINFTARLNNLDRQLQYLSLVLVGMP